MAEQHSAEEGEILRIARIVWPQGEPELLDRARHTRADASLYAVIPNVAKPRLLAPVGATAAGARAMLESNDALTTRQRLSRAAAWAALNLGAGRRAPSLLAVSDGAGSLHGYLEDALGEELNLVLGIGTPRANRKPVVRLNSTDGRLVGFAKVGVNALTNELVERERGALAEINARPWQLIRPPQVLHFGRWRDNAVLVLSAVPAPFRPLPPRRLRPPVIAAAELATAWGVRRERLADSGFSRRLTSQVQALAAGPAVQELQDGLRALARRYGGETVTMAAWHGDFTPWNMVAAEGRLSLWDWEQFGHDVPLGFDPVHYEVNVRTHRHGMTEDAVREGLRAGTAHLDERQARALAAAYLGAIATRYTLGEQESGGNIVSRNAALMRRLLRAEAGADG